MYVRQTASEVVQRSTVGVKSCSDAIGSPNPEVVEQNTIARNDGFYAEKLVC